jgi:hypothetical protein
MTYSESSISVKGVFFIILVCIFFIGDCSYHASQTDEIRDRAKKTAEKFGFENPVVTSESIWWASYSGCSRDDNFFFDISAVKDSKKENITLCCSGLSLLGSIIGITAKGCTIRSQ